MSTRSERRSHDRLDELTLANTRCPAELAELEQIIATASRERDSWLEMRARVRWMTASADHLRTRAERLMNLSWCLSWLETHPRDGDRALLGRVLRESQLRVPEMALDPAVTLGDIRTLLASYHRLVRRGGFSEHSEHALRMRVSLLLGELGDCLYWRARCDESFCDELSPCSGCEATDDLLLDGILHHFGSARVSAQQALDVQFHSCERPGKQARSLALRTLTLTGHHEQARQLAAEAAAALSVPSEDPSAVARLIYWAAWTGDELRAWALLCDHLPTLDSDWGRLEGHRMSFLAAGSYALGRLRDLGRGEEPMADATVGALADRWAREAMRLARLFDARNHSDNVSRYVASMLADPGWDGTTITSAPAASDCSILVGPVTGAEPSALLTALRTLRWWRRR